MACCYDENTAVVAMATEMLAGIVADKWKGICSSKIFQVVVIIILDTAAGIFLCSLALTGEIIEANSVWQGAPASRVFEYGPTEGSFHYGTFV